MRSGTPVFGFLGLGLLVGILAGILVSLTGVPDGVVIGSAAAVMIGVAVLCIRMYTPGPESHRSHAVQHLGLRLYNSGGSPTLEEVAEHLEAGARKRSRGKRKQQRHPTRGKTRHHQ